MWPLEGITMVSRHLRAHKSSARLRIVQAPPGVRTARLCRKGSSESSGWTAAIGAKVPLLEKPTKGGRTHTAPETGT